MKRRGDLIQGHYSRREGVVWGEVGARVWSEGRHHVVEVDRDRIRGQEDNTWSRVMETGARNGQEHTWTSDEDRNMRDGQEHTWTSGEVRNKVGWSGGREHTWTRVEAAVARGTDVDA